VNFSELRQGEVAKIYLPRARVNRGRNRCGLAASRLEFPAEERLYFVDERQQFFQSWVGPLPTLPTEAGLGRFVRLVGELVSRRPPSRIDGVWNAFHREPLSVWPTSSDRADSGLAQ